jgi:hypothetical protein
MESADAHRALRTVDASGYPRRTLSLSISASVARLKGSRYVDVKGSRYVDVKGSRYVDVKATRYIDEKTR